MLLAKIRKLAGMTQTEVVEALGVSQAQVSQIEKQDNMQVSTLRRLVETLGGELEIVVKLPKERITVSQFSDRAA